MEIVIPIPISEIVRTVGDYYDVRPSHITGRSRHRSIVLARFVAMYFVRKLREMSLEEIGYSFGYRDHSTVMWAIKQVNLRMRRDWIFERQIAQLESKLSGANPAVEEDYWIWAA